MLWELLGSLIDGIGYNILDLSKVFVFVVGLYVVIGFLFSLRPVKKK